MKICFITHNIFDLGGIQRVVSVIANELSQNHEVDILCTSNEFEENRKLYNLINRINVEINSTIVDKKYFSNIIHKVLRNINTKSGLLNSKITSNLLTEIYIPKEVQRNMINYLNTKEYDLVIGVAGFNSLLLATIAEEIEAKTIGWQHNSYDAYLKSRGRYFYNQDEIFKKHIPKLDKYIVLTEHDQRMFKENMNIDSTVIYNPTSFKSDKKSPIKNKQFLAAGRFNYQKGFDMLIESFNLFAKDNKEWNLVIVGEGEEKEKIEGLINKYNLNNRVRIDNFTDNIKEYFLNSSILLLSSRWEGMPMIVLESLEMGVPIISYDITAVQPLIDNNENGLIVEKFDIESFRQAMRKGADYIDLNEMSQKAIKKSKEFQIENIIKKWDEIIR